MNKDNRTYGHSFWKIIGTSLLAAAALASSFNISAGNPELRLPEIPSRYTTPEERASYLISNFWQLTPPMPLEKSFFEEEISTFFAIMKIASPEVSAKATGDLLDRLTATPGAVADFANLAYLYLYSPESPFYDEEGYMTVATALTSQNHLAEIDQAEQQRIAARIDEIQKNRIGTVANDFRYLDLADTTHTLSGSDGKRRLVVFYDNDCDRCHKLLTGFASDPQLKEWVHKENLLIVAIEAYGADPSEWKNASSSFPAEWLTGRSPEGEIDQEEIYILPATPTLYIISPERKVEKKALTLQQLIEQ